MKFVDYIIVGMISSRDVGIVLDIFTSIIKYITNYNIIINIYIYIELVFLYLFFYHLL